MHQNTDHSRCLHLYVLDASGHPRRESDIEVWADWMNGRDHTLAYTQVLDSVRVVTEFVGNDQRRTKDGAPLLWETIVFGGPHHLRTQRDANRVDALRSHEEAVSLARGEHN
jgi:hypothetical protein